MRCAAGSTFRSRWTTTPTWGRWGSTRSAPAEAAPSSCTSSCPPGSAAASSCAAAPIGAPGGQLSLAAALLLEPLRDWFRRYAVQAAAEAVEIVVGQLGERAEVVGALALGIRSFEPVLARQT